MVAFEIINFALFCIYPLVGVQAFQNPSIVSLCNQLTPWIGKTLDYVSFYKLAFRKSAGYKRSKIAFVGCLAKFLLMVCLTNAVGYINFYEVPLENLGSQKVWLDIGQMLYELIPEILIGFILAHAGLSKFAFTTPFFFTATLWVIYIHVGSFILSEVTKNPSMIQATDFNLSNPQVTHTVTQLLRHKHEPVMGITLASLLTFSLDIEMLIMNVIDHVLAGVVGYVAIVNAGHPVLLAFKDLTAGVVEWVPGKDREQAAALAVMVILSFHVHYAFNVVLLIGKSLGRKHKLLETPFDH